MKRKPQGNDKIYYCEIFRDYPAIRYVRYIETDNVPRQDREALDQVKTILRIGPCGTSFIRNKNWLVLVKRLGLDVVVPKAVKNREQREQSYRKEGLISHIYESPFPGKDNPCPNIIFIRKRR